MKLTEKQKKNIIAAYAAGDITQSELAKKYKVSCQTISRIIKNDPDFVKKSEDIKKEVEEEAVKSMTEYLNSRKAQGQSLIDRLLDIPDELISASSLRDRVGAANYIYNMHKEKTTDDGGKEALDKLCAAIASIGSEDGAPDG